MNLYYGWRSASIATFLLLTSLAVPASKAHAITAPTDISGDVLWLDGADQSSVTLNYFNTSVTVTSTSSNTTILSASAALPAYVATSSLIRIGATDVYTVATVSGSVITTTAPVAYYASAQPLYSARVSQWNDKSGNAANAVQATGASQFTWLATGDNGQSGLYHAAGVYSGSGQWFGGTFATPFSTSTVFAVANMAVKSGSDSNYFEMTTSTPMYSTHSSGISVDNTSYNVVEAPRAGSYFNDAFTTSFLQNVPSFITLGVSDNNRALTVDGIAQPSYDGATVVLPQYAKYNVGAEWAFNFPTAQLNGRIDELIIYNRALTSSEQAAVQQYLFSKWGASTAQSAPQSLSATSTRGAMTLSWTAPSNFGDLAPYDYDIQYKLDSSPSWIEFPHAPLGTNVTSATISGLTANTLYDFQVAAVNALGTSTAFASISATPIAGVSDAPTSLNLTSTQPGTFTASWQAPANTGGSPITAYSLACAPIGSATSTVSVSSGTSYTFSSIASLGLFGCTVAAINASGASVPSTYAVGSAFNTSDPSSYGYQLTFDDEFNSTSTFDTSDTGGAGYNWYFKEPFGYPDVATGSVGVTNGELTLSGLTNQGDGIQSAYATSSTDYVGTTFSGGWYIEARVKFNGDGVHTVNGFPAFWAYPIENYEAWQGNPSHPIGPFHTVEDDFFEFEPASTNPTPPCSLFSTFGDHSPGGVVSNSNNTVCLPGINFDNVYHTYGQLWVPAANGQMGYVVNYFDGVPSGSYVTYMDPPGSTPYSYMEQLHYSIILTTGSDAASTYDYVRVWQLPRFSGISASTSSSTANVLWNTRDYTSQGVAFGTTTAYSYWTPQTNQSTTTVTTAHTVALSGLIPCTSYHFAVLAGDLVGGYATSTDQTFTTTGCPTPAPSSGNGPIFVGSASPAGNHITPIQMSQSASPETAKSNAEQPAALSATSESASLILGTTTVTFRRNLTPGSTGSEVRDLQSRLIADGYLAINSPTGYFGSLTLAALKHYQLANRIPATGYFGPQSRASMNLASAENNQSPLQNQLSADLAELAALEALLREASSTLISSGASTTTATTTP